MEQIESRVNAFIKCVLLIEPVWYKSLIFVVTG